MAKDKPLHPFWKHAIVTIASVFAFAGALPAWIPPVVYLTGVAIYYAGRWCVRTLHRGPVSTWYYPVRRLAWAGGLSLVGAVAMVIATNIQTGRSTDGINLTLQATVLTVTLVPFCFAGLLVLSLPGRVLGWEKRRRRERQLSDERARDAKERTRLQLERQVIAYKREQSDRSAQQRRTEARAQCELFYGLYAAEIADRFPRHMFEAFLKTYMGDDQDPPIVERRGAELRGIIQQHKQAVKPDAKPRTIAELSQWYLSEKAKIESLEIEDRIKKAHLVQLNVRYSELTQDLLQKIEP